MPVLKIDVSDVDPEQSSQITGPSPRPGLYRSKITRCVLGYKDRDKETDPRIEVTYRTNDPKHGSVGGEVRDWLVTDYKGESDFPQRKLDQFLLATGVVTKSKRKAQFDPEKLVGKEVWLRVTAGTIGRGDRMGDYVGNAGGVWAINTPGLEQMAGADPGAAAAANGAADKADFKAAAPAPTPAPAAEEEESSVELVDLVAYADESEDSTRDSEDEQIQALWSFFDEQVGDDTYDPNNYSTWQEWYDTLLADQVIEVDQEEVEEAEAEEESEEEEAAEEEEEAADYSSWSLTDLKAECTNRGLPATGTKPVLVQRLEEHDASEPF